MTGDTDGALVGTLGLALGDTDGDDVGLYVSHEPSSHVAELLKFTAKL